MFAVSQALANTIGLIIIFGGIGLIVNALIGFIVAQVLGERAQKVPPPTRSPDRAPR